MPAILLITSKLHSGFLFPENIVTLNTLTSCVRFTGFYSVSIHHSSSSGLGTVNPPTWFTPYCLPPLVFAFAITLGVSGIGSPSALH